MGPLLLSYTYTCILFLRTLYFREEERRLKAIQAEEAIIASWKRQQDETLRQMQVIEQMQKLKMQEVSPPTSFGHFLCAKWFVLMQ